jgi:uncharacterized protein YjbJ (UPF0337 family)
LAAQYNWGYFPSGGLGLALIIVIVLLVFGRHHDPPSPSGDGEIQISGSGDRHLGAGCLHPFTTGDAVMDKDRIQGSLKQVVGRIKEAVGRVVGDRKTEADGKAEMAAGKVQNALAA